MPNPRHDSNGRFAKKAPGEPVVKATKGQGFSTFDELGRPTSNTGNQLYKDFVPALSGSRFIRTMGEMKDNDSTVGSILFGIEMLLRRMSWEEAPYDDTPQDLEAAAFLGECRQDMSHTWPDHMAAVVTMLPFGFAPFELVYRMRTPAGNSRFADGRIGWRRFGYRPQETLVKWVYDEDGGLAGMVQQAGNVQVTIPIEKLLLYQTKPGMGTPESKSILRTAYRSWWAKKRAEEIMLVGLERNLAGLPVLRIPAASIIAGDSLYTRATLMAQRLRQDEQMGVVWPSDRWEDGSEMYGIDTLKTPGSPGIDPIEVVRMYSADIAASVLADFISLGRDATGSRALADPKQELFQQALSAWADSIEECLNRFAVPRLFALNDFKVDRLPTLKHGPIEKVDLAELGQFVLQLSQAGHDWGFLNEADTIGGQVRQLAGFDPAPEPATRKRLPVGQQQWQV
jgi:hypothetical protein